ncbi:MAG: hypothetical protein SGCHY_003821 [Lobulomycetales sp.]
MSLLRILVTLAVFVAIGFGLYVSVPKRSPDVLVWHTAIVVSLVCMYTMWMVTYVAQLNPLIQPERSFGPGMQHG